MPKSKLNIDRIEAETISVNVESELMVCMCDKTCENHLSLSDLEKRFPGLKISLRVKEGKDA